MGRGKEQQQTKTKKKGRKQQRNDDNLAALQSRQSGTSINININSPENLLPNRPIQTQRSMLLLLFILLFIIMY